MTETSVPPEVVATAKEEPPAESSLALKRGNPYATVLGDDLPVQIKSARAAAGYPVDGLEFKSVRTEVKANVGKREVEIWTAAYEIFDDGDDWIPYGAAGKSIELLGPRGENLIKHFYNHVLLLGPVKAIEEHREGILQVGLVDEHPDLDRYLQHAKSGAAGHGSIGYRVIRSSPIERNGRKGRSLDEIEIWEGSIVPWPMNRNARVVAVGEKGAQANEGKSLFAFAGVVEAQARIDSALAYIEDMTESDWAKLTPSEIEKVTDLLSRMSQSEKSIRSRMHLEPKPDPALAQKLSGLLKDIRSLLGPQEKRNG